jgi:hypothetical protein
VVVRNARLVAGREYGVRVRSRAFAISTLILAIVATIAALAPLAIRALERESVVRIAASAPDAPTSSAWLNPAASRAAATPPGRSQACSWSPTVPSSAWTSST